MKLHYKLKRAVFAPFKLSNAELTLSLWQCIHSAGDGSVELLLFHAACFSPKPHATVIRIFVSVLCCRVPFCKCNL